MAETENSLTGWEARTGTFIKARLPSPAWLLVKYLVFIPFWFAFGFISALIAEFWPYLAFLAFLLLVKAIWGDAAAGGILLLLLLFGAAVGDDGDGGGGGGGGGNKRAEKYIKWRAWHSMG